MCEFPSWIETKDGEVYFLTDKDLKNSIFKDNTDNDLVGHSAIEKMYPKIEGKYKELFPVHPEVLKAINSGKMNKLMKLGGYKKITFDSNGKPHSKNDEPAEIFTNGVKMWYNHGKIHREDGPAIEYFDGSKSWYLNGKLYREDGPAYENSNGDKYWYLNGKYHRTDGPAIEYPDGTKYWYLNDKLHRNDGPACEYADGTKYWYLNGKKMPRSKFRKIMSEKRAKLAAKKNKKTNPKRKKN